MDGFAWMGFAMAGFCLSFDNVVLGQTFPVVDCLTEEEVDLEAYRCCR